MDVNLGYQLVGILTYSDGRPWLFRWCEECSKFVLPFAYPSLVMSSVFASQCRGSYWLNDVQAIL